MRKISKKKKKKKTMNNLDERKSGFGGLYPDSVESDWKEMPGFGWLHRVENNMFAELYEKCWLTEKYYEARLMADSKIGRVNREEATKQGWEECADFERLYPKNELVEVRDAIGAKRKVCVRAREDGYLKCDYSGDWYMSRHTVIVKSQKYKRVAIAVVKKHFKKCTACGNWHDPELVKMHEGYEAPWCDPCWVKHNFRNVIHKHDYNGYPQAIIKPRLRLGHTLDRKGLLISTGKKTECFDFRLWGLEIETELDMDGCIKDSLTRHHVAVSVLETLGKDYVICKEDGTLLMNGHYANNRRDGLPNNPAGPTYAGFEIVTAPSCRATHMERIPKLAEMACHKHLRAWDTDTCGFHVHVTRQALTYLQIYRMLRFVNAKENTLFIQKIAGRGSEKFCKYMPKDANDATKVDERNDENRRQAINLCNESTLEFRIFRGTVNHNHILRNLEFCEATCDFCAPGSRSLKEMDDYRNFVRFVDSNRKTWPLLASWFAMHKIISANLKEKILRPKKIVYTKKNGKSREKMTNEEVVLDVSKFTLKTHVDEPEIKVAGKLKALV